MLAECEESRISISILAVSAVLSMASSGIGLPLPFSVRRRVINQLREVAKAFSTEVLPAPLLPTKIVMLLGFCGVGANQISRFLNIPILCRITR
jgi:hypothetical protein